MKKDSRVWRRFGLTLLIIGALALVGCSSLSLESFKTFKGFHMAQENKQGTGGQDKSPEESSQGDGNTAENPIYEDKDDLIKEGNENSNTNEEGTDDPVFIEIPPTQNSQESPANMSPEPAPPGTPVRTFYELSGTPPTAPGLAMKHRVFKEEPSKIVYLTIDDGPSENTGPILEVLKREGVNATFFVIGSQVERYPELLKKAYEQGNAIGNHTYSHNYSEIYQSPEAFVANLKKNEDLIYQLIGVRPKVIRTPGGTHGNFHISYYNAVDALDYLVYDWNVSTGDASAPLVSAETIIRNVKEQVPGRDRIILLMHDAPGKWTTVEALPKIIRFLKEQGYEFGVLSPEVAPILFPGGFHD
ncbi:MAG TPA: polysaccharide deacetylase [Desulfitobacterium dehalogenans]|uniref:Polysaccharide deacetylase n=1 Tax=Desulfitobacterium dehalogenans TaxID=36854 RepID=A0A7C6Z6Z9_9FIRM|nr:polysaccharide deacetylase [Desulfitobacterium dehalogenans]